MAHTIDHRRQRTRRVIRMARLCFAVVIVTLTMAACFHPDGIDLNFVNPGPNNYTQLTFDDQLVGDGNLSANTRYSLSGVKSGIYSIIGFNGAGFFDLQVTVYGTDNEDTWTGPGASGGNGSWSSR